MFDFFVAPDPDTLGCRSDLSRLNLVFDSKVVYNMARSD